MNPARLLAHFDRISEAPAAIPRFRQFILELAVRGKLVERDPNDAPASELLKHIHAEIDRRIASGQLAKQATLPQVQPDEEWFEIPATWRWARLGMITQVVMGQSPPGDTYNTAGEGVPLINGPVEFTEGPFGMTVVNQYTTAPTNLCEEGDLLVCVRGSTTGRTNIAGFRACIGRGVAAIRPFFADDYVRCFIWRQRPSIIAMGRGIAFPSVSRQQIAELPVPLPPLAEQQRIVAKVDELMALCDRLEAAQAERESRRNRLAVASLQRLNEPADSAAAGAFREHARFHLAHLPRVTTRPEHVQQLRQTLLNLAVRGQLVPQDANDEPARYFGIGESPKEQDRLSIRLPFGWNWARIEHVASARLGKMLDRAKNRGRRYQYLRNTNVHWFSVRADGLKELRVEDDEVEKYILRPGDVLICEGGHGIGRTAVWRVPDKTIVFQKALHRVRPGPSLHSDFFSYCVSVYFDAGVLQTYFTGVGIPHFTGRALAALVFPLPPMTEQHRIVAKVDELMALCDRLEAQLSITQTERRRLLEALLHEALIAAA